MSEYRARPQNASFLQGLILAGLIVFAGYLLNEQGLIGLLLAGDRSGISYLIACIWLVLTLRWLWLLRWLCLRCCLREMLWLCFLRLLWFLR